MLLSLLLTACGVDDPATTSPQTTPAQHDGADHHDGAGHDGADHHDGAAHAPPDGAASNAAFLDADLDVATWTARFEAADREVFARRADIVAAMDLAPGSAIADIGAGTGGLLDVLVAAVGPEGTVFATELSPGFRDHLVARAAAEGWSGVQVIAGQPDTTGLAEASVDAMLLCDVYHHLETPEAFLADAAKALRPGGTLHVVDFDPGRPGASDWVKDHVHQTADAVRIQIVATGNFAALPDPDLELVENRMLRFRRL